MTEKFALQASIRETLGSSDARRMRKEGKIPATVYGGKEGKPLSIAIDSREFTKEYLKGDILTRIAEITIDGKTVEAMPYAITRHPVTEVVTHVDFKRFNKSDEVKVKVRLNFVNRDKSAGLKRGGYLNIVMRKVDLYCKADKIPQSIDVDVKNMLIGSNISSKDIELPEGSRLVSKKALPVVTILGKGGKADPADVAAEAAKAAAPAAAAKPAAAAPAKKK